MRQIKRRSVLVTAGPTREKIDPIRFISNYSTGIFGYAIAKEAARRGCRVTLVSGPTALKAPLGVNLVRVESASEMRRAVETHFKKADCLIMSAAVSDWRPLSQAREKIKQHGRMTLELVDNPDILQEAGMRKGKRVIVGFSLESAGLLKNAVKKLREKNLDLIVANRLSKSKSVFGQNKTDLLLVDRLGNQTILRNKSKDELAKIILDKVFNCNI